MSLLIVMLQESADEPASIFVLIGIGVVTLLILGAFIYLALKKSKRPEDDYWLNQFNSQNPTSLTAAPPPVLPKGTVEYLTYSFENTYDGLRQKDQYTRKIAASGYRIIREQIEQGHIKGGEQCCLALICLPAIFLAGRTPGNIIVTYAREPQDESTKKCPFCAETIQKAAVKCRHCGGSLSDQ